MSLKSLFPWPKFLFFFFLAWVALTWPIQAAPRAVYTAADAFVYTYPEIGRLPHEALCALFVDAQGAVLKVARITQYRSSELFYVPWELLLTKVIPRGTVKLYLVHNHPGNTLALSRGDIDLGSFWAAVAARLGIELDLLAITPDGQYVSLRESGQLKLLPNEGPWEEYLGYILEPSLAILRSRLAEEFRRTFSLKERQPPSLKRQE